jgi:hypothetical protein
MSTSFTTTETRTFTITHAKYLASKIKTDLKRIQRLYDRPSDKSIDEYEAEATALLKAGYLQSVTYGFQRDGKWIEPTLIYNASEIANWSGSDEDPGRIRPGADVAGASFTSYLTYAPAWSKLPFSEQTKFEQGLPFKRTGMAAPGVTGYLVEDRTYSAGNQILSRSSVRSLS